MTNLAKCKLNLEFEFGRARDQFMVCVVAYNGLVFPLEIAADQDHAMTQITLHIELPCRIVLQLTGKQPNDTVLDQNNCIVKDTYVKLSGVKIDDFKLNQIFLCQKVQLRTTGGQEIITNYFGFNGQVNLDFSKSSVMSQVLHCNRA